MELASSADTTKGQTKVHQQMATTDSTKRHLVAVIISSTVLYKYNKLLRRPNVGLYYIGNLVLLHIQNIECLFLAHNTRAMSLAECPLTLDSRRSNESNTSQLNIQQYTDTPMPI